MYIDRPWGVATLDASGVQWYYLYYFTVELLHDSMHLEIQDIVWK